MKDFDKMRQCCTFNLQGNLCSLALSTHMILEVYLLLVKDPLVNIFCLLVARFTGSEKVPGTWIIDHESCARNRGIQDSSLLARSSYGISYL